MTNNEEVLDVIRDAETVPEKEPKKVWYRMMKAFQRIPARLMPKRRHPKIA